MNACENQGFETTDIQHCYSSNELYGVNPREPLGGQPTAHEAVGDALCVVQKNTAIPVIKIIFKINSSVFFLLSYAYILSGGVL